MSALDTNQLPRFFIPDITAFTPLSPLELPRTLANHIFGARRLMIGTTIVLFNAAEQEAIAVLANKHPAIAHITQLLDSPPVASPLRLSLIQALCRTQRMDYCIQKATELGVHQVLPIYTQHCVIPPLDLQRTARKLKHWQEVTTSAAQQCGRRDIPTIANPKPLREISLTSFDQYFLLSPTAAHSFRQITLPRLPENTPPRLAILVGPEGGLSPSEICWAEQQGFTPIRLGPYLLRTETAGPASIAALQTLWGNFC